MDYRSFDDHYDAPVQNQVGNNLGWILVAVVAIIVVGAIAMGVRDQSIPGPPITPPAYNSSIGAIKSPDTNASSLTLVKEANAEYSAL